MVRNILRVLAIVIVIIWIFTPRALWKSIDKPEQMEHDGTFQRETLSMMMNVLTVRVKELVGGPLTARIFQNS